MKMIEYKCNLCGNVGDSMNALVIVPDRPFADATDYVLGTRDRSNFIHVCRTCIDRLAKMFAQKERDE